jgi:hypothetical protein
VKKRAHASYDERRGIEEFKTLNKLSCSVAADSVFTPFPFAKQKPGEDLAPGFWLFFFSL